MMKINFINCSSLCFCQPWRRARGCVLEPRQGQQHYNDVSIQRDLKPHTWGNQGGSLGGQVEGCVTGDLSTGKVSTTRGDEARPLLEQDVGICFNCPSRDHKVVACCSPNKCWSCHHLGHISTRCPSHKTFNASPEKKKSDAIQN
jgi:hypothetical protein